MAVILELHKSKRSHLHTSPENSLYYCIVLPYKIPLTRSYNKPMEFLIAQEVKYPANIQLLRELPLYLVKWPESTIVYDSPFFHIFPNKYLPKQYQQNRPPDMLPSQDNSTPR